MTSPNLGYVDFIGRLQAINAPYHIADTAWDETEILLPNWITVQTFEYHVTPDGWGHMRGYGRSEDLLMGTLNQPGSALAGGPSTLVQLPPEMYPSASVYVPASGRYQTLHNMMVEVTDAGEVILPLTFGGVWGAVPGIGNLYISSDIIKFDGVKWRTFQGDEDEDFVE